MGWKRLITHGTDGGHMHLGYERIAEPGGTKAYCPNAPPRRSRRRMVETEQPSQPLASTNAARDKRCLFKRLSARRTKTCLLERAVRARQQMALFDGRLRFRWVILVPRTWMPC